MSTPRVIGVVLAAGLGLFAVRPATGSSPGPRGSSAPLQQVHAVGPPLTVLGTKLASAKWLVAWLQQPSRVRRHPLMRRLRLSADEVRAVAAYLYEPQPPSDGGVQWRGGDPDTGKSLFVTRGCRGCHAIEPTEQSFSPRIPHLAGIGIKVRGDWLFKWLKSPRAYDPDTAMPELGLNDDDARHLVAFLLSHREGAEVVASVPRVEPRAASGVARDVIRRFDCAKCHRIEGVRAVAPATGWTAAPRGCAGCHESSGSSPQETTLQGDSAEAALRDGRRLTAFYSCGGCHLIEGTDGAIARHLDRKTFIPPTLDGEGARVQTSWLVEYLHQPTRLRPWLQMRMPDYGLSLAEAEVLARYFAALAHVPPTDEPHDAAGEAIIETGRRRFAHFKCLQCHPATTEAQEPVGVDLEDLSINLTYAKTRLRPSWVRDFLARPKTVVGMETRMPTVFYTTDGAPKVDRPREDIAALTAYLFRMQEASAGAPTPTTPAGGNEQPAIDWSTYPY